MPSGLVALLDDVALIAKAAASSLDDVGVAASRAGGKAAGVVIDDAAVTPGYMNGFTPDRELPIVYKIIKGSLFNKLLILLPAGLFLSAVLPWAIMPILMLGGAFLCYEGAEKVMEKLGGAKHGKTVEDVIADRELFEKQRVSGAIRTDLILSGEIMAITLAEVAAEPFMTRALALALVGVVITLAVYGAVALIVKMDDIGLHLSRRENSLVQRFGCVLVHAMPKLLTLLSTVGTIAMLWVGGGIILHGLAEMGLHGPADIAHGIQHAVERATGALSGVLGWLTYAAISAVVGVVLGAVIALVLHKIFKLGDAPGAH